jgi:hypothetical protein
MKTNIFIFILFILLAINTQAQYYLEKDYIEMRQQNNELTSFTYKNLRIVPFFAGTKFLKAHENTGNYKTLKQALDEKKIEINETSGGTVNQLMIRNLSSDTIFIMAGELISGGKQDRVTGENMLLPPGKNFTPIQVFCVEQGRWSYGGKENAGFQQHNAFTANSIRSEAVQKADQSAVWSKISEVTSKNKSSSSTGNFNAVYSNKEFMEEFNQYLTYFKAQFATLSHCIGFMGISGDKIIGCDIFATPELFSKQYENLITAYITDAITHNKKPSLSDIEIGEYLLTFLNKDIDQEKAINEKGKSFSKDGKKLHIAVF